MAIENKKMKQRRDTAANWTSVNPVLAAGEIGYETDTNKFKIGDGVSAWTAITNYFEAGASGIGGSTGATDNAILRASGTGGSTLDTSLAIIDDSGYLGVPTASFGTVNIYSLSDTNTGFSLWGSDAVAFISGGSAQVGFGGGANSFNAGNAFQYGWNSAGSAFGGGIDTGLVRGAVAKFVKFTDGSTGGGGIQLEEITAPASPSANNVYVFVKDNSSVTELTALFSTGDGVRFNSAGNVIADGYLFLNGMEFRALTDQRLFLIDSGNSNFAAFDTAIVALGLKSDWQFAWSSTTPLGAGVDTGLKRVSAGVVGVTNGSTGGGALSFIEMTAPSAPSANGCYLYTEDDGAGKTRLMALFSSGAAQQVAIQP